MSRWLLSLAGALVLVALAPGTAAAADPTEVCSTVADSLKGEEKAVVATTVAGDRVQTAALTLYPGSRVSVALCQADGDALPTRGGDLWDLAGHPALANTTDRGDYWTVTVGTADESAAFADLVANQSQVVQGPTLRVQTGVQYESQVSNETLLFADPASRDALERNETAFREAVAAVETNATALNRTAVAAGEPLEPGAIGRANATLSNLTGATQAMTRRTHSTERLLYEQAASRVGNEGALTAIEAVNAEERTARQQTREQLRAYQETVDQRIRAARGAVRTNVLIGLAVGCLVGLAAGAVRPYLAYREYDDFRATTTSASYERRVVYLPVGVGLALLVAGVVLAALTGALGVFA